MKILWLAPNFLHPTTKGGQIRSLEMLRHLSRWHEIHYVAIENPEEPEGLARAGEYSYRAYPLQHRVPSKRSAAFAVQLARGLVSSMPVAVDRFCSSSIRAEVSRIASSQSFDRTVIDFLVPAAWTENPAHCVLFQHNVETVIWQRRLEHARNRAERLYLKRQMARMRAYEARICSNVAHVAAVSEVDAVWFRERFGLQAVTAVPTGVDAEAFTPQPAAPCSDLVFVGSMDWMPNDDGIRWFLNEVLPVIHASRPQTTLTIAGRKPAEWLRAVAARDSRITVTGTVPDVRPYLWGSRISIVPLRIGGGTRLKIYEAMAAALPVVSTPVGAEGLGLNPPHDVRLAEDPAGFAAECLRLLAADAERAALGAHSRELVRTHYSWEASARALDAIVTQYGYPRVPR